MPKVPFSVKIKPYIPELIWWTIITSIFVHKLQLKQKSEADNSRCNAQISVLETLLARAREGQLLGEEDVQRELELVGLRERTKLTMADGEDLKVGMDISWREALLGRKKGRTKETAEEAEEKAVQEWADSEY
jgi:hypothetical protein